MEKKWQVFGLVMFCMFVISGCAKAPDADFKASPLTGLAPLEVFLTDMSTSKIGIIEKWNWDFGDGECSDQQNPKHIYTASGKYTVSLTVTNEFELDNTVTKKDYIEVIEAPKLDPISGLWFSPFKDGQDPYDGDVASKQQVRERMSIIRYYTDRLISYYDENTAMIAYEFGLMMTTVVWLSDNEAENQKQLNWAIQLANQGYVDVIAVGFEVLFRDGMSELELLDDIDQVRAAVPVSVKVTYIDNHATLAQYPAVIDACDIIYVVIHPFWEGADIDRAVDYLEEKYLAFKKEIGDVDKKIVIITGWPDQGDSMGDAEATLENACQFYKEFSVWAEKNKVEYFLTAFDEEYRDQYEGSQAGHWGLWDSQGELKSCLIKQEE